MGNIFLQFVAQQMLRSNFRMFVALITNYARKTFSYCKEEKLTNVVYFLQLENLLPVTAQMLRYKLQKNVACIT